MIDLDKVMKENYKDIKNNTYKWNDDEIKELYRIAHIVCNELSIPSEEVEDYVEEMIYCFFTHVTRKYSIHKHHSIYAYASKAFWNVYFQGRKNYLGTVVSLEEKNRYNQTYLDVASTLKDNLYKEEIEEEYLEVIDFLKSNYDKYKYLYEYYINGKTFRKIALKVKLKMHCVYNLYTNELEEFKNEEVVKKALTKKVKA